MQQILEHLVRIAASGLLHTMNENGWKDKLLAKICARLAHLICMRRKYVNWGAFRLFTLRYVRVYGNCKRFTILLENSVQCTSRTIVALKETDHIYSTPGFAYHLPPPSPSVKRSISSCHMQRVSGWAVYMTD